MQNWSTGIESLKKDPEHYQQWELEQLINFGLGEKKLNETLMRRYWAKLQIDPARQRFLGMLIYGDGYSQQETN